MLKYKKNENNLQIYIIIGLLAIIALLIFSINSRINKYDELSYDYYTLELDNNKNIQLNSDYNSLLINEINKFIDLHSKYLVLEYDNFVNIEKIKNLTKDKNTLTADYNTLSNEYTSLMTEINTFKTQITQSMDWFKANSTIDDISDSDRLKSHLRTCVSCNEETCIIKTACIDWFVNERKFNLKYADDNTISNKEDKLQSLDSFLLNEAGDCEDYSLLFTAEIKYLVDYIIVERQRTPVIEAMIKTNTTVDYKIVGDWYYNEGIEAYPLDKDYIYPTVACGDLFDPQTNEYNGHCVIMITNKDIDSVSDLSKLNKIYLIEPQFGDFIGFAKYDGVIKTDDNSRIDLLITKKDLYMHESRFYVNSNYTNANWYGYETFLNEINSIQK